VARKVEVNLVTIPSNNIDAKR